MRKTCAPQLSTDELIDALEARIAAIRSRNGASAHPVGASITPGVLRAEMEKASVSAVELANAVGVPPGDLDDWIARLFYLLTPAARWKLLQAPRANGRQHSNRTHPFSKIEEL